MNENRSPIPSRLYNAAKGGHVAGTADIIDDNKGKTQDVINKEIDSALENRYTKNETYSKTELNNLITTPEQKYVTLTAQSGNTLEDIFNGITGAANTIYRVGSWDGNQYNTTKYAEYGWTGTNFVPLDVKEYGIDDEPTAGSDNLVKSGGVANKISELEENNGEIRTQEGFYNLADGIYRTGTEYISTIKVKCRENRVIKIIGIADNINNIFILFWKENGEYINYKNIVDGISVQIPTEARFFALDLSSDAYISSVKIIDVTEIKDNSESIKQTNYKVSTLGNVVDSVKEDVENVQNIVFYKSTKEEIIKSSSVEKNTFVHKNNGVIILNESYNTYWYEVSDIDILYITARIVGVNCAMAIFYDANGNYIGYQNDGTATYTHEKISIPNGTTKIAVSTQKKLPTLYKEITELEPKSFVENKLKGKSALFFGDSVMRANCGSHSNPYGGWAKLIGETNAMQWQNLGVNGATIRRMDGRSCILDVLKSADKTKDYYIIQGGLNDSFNKASWLHGEITSGYDDEFDESMTYGALEAVCKYALSELHNKKVGFIINYVPGSFEKWNEYADNFIKIFKKWGMPYIDLRECAGFNLANTTLRALYGMYTGSAVAYSETASYVIDDIVKYNGTAYKCNSNISAPAGTFDESKWTQISSGSDYDSVHCNIAAYKLSNPRIEAWIKSL